MGGGDHHEPPYKIPDWRIYRVEDSPKLMSVQKALASIGLKDPWLRNEVWRFTEMKDFTFFRYTYRILSVGFKWGLAAALVTTLVENTFFGHGHGHGHDEKENH